MSDTQTDDGQCWPPSPDTPEGRAQLRICALDMAIRCRQDEFEPTRQTTERAKEFRAFLEDDNA